MISTPGRKKPHTGPRKATTDTRLSIDIREFMRGIHGNVGGKTLYRWNSPRNDMPVATLFRLTGRNQVSVKHVAGSLPDEVLDLIYTGCNLGGRRAWFVCSRIGCGRKAAILYDTPKGFRCRHCARLIYQSTREREYDRLLRRARRVRFKAGGGNNLLEDFPERPKGMHWETYDRLHEQEAILWGPICERAEKRLGNQRHTNGNNPTKATQPTP
jgi:hypothetical protein